MIAAFYIAKANRLAVELRETREQRDNYRASWTTALTRLDLANQREEALFAKVAELEHHLELMSCDNADLERANAELQKTVDAYTTGLSWFEGSEA